MTTLTQLSLLLALSATLCAGETRTWKSADGSKSFSAELIGRTPTEVTLRRRDGKKLTFALDKLHAEDRRWLNLKHPVEVEPKVEEIPEDTTIFDSLKFGDTREIVSSKLGESTIVEAGVAGVFQGRTGLNGIYRTTHKIGGLSCFLFFDWDESGGLKEVSLQTESQKADAYITVLKPCWEQCIPLITSIHGNSTQQTAMPSASALKDGQMLASHLWKLDHGGTVLLGTAKEGAGYQVVVRFTRDRIGPNATLPRP